MWVQTLLFKSQIIKTRVLSNRLFFNLDNLLELNTQDPKLSLLLYSLVLSSSYWVLIHPLAILPETKKTAENTLVETKIIRPTLL